MNDTIPPIVPPSPETNGKEDSRLLGVSIRAWLAILLTLAVCALSILGREVLEPLYGLAYLAVGFYFGQKNK